MPLKWNHNTNSWELVPTLSKPYGGGTADIPAVLKKITESNGLPLWNGSAWPGGTGGSSADLISYNDPTYTTVDAALDSILHPYVAPHITLAGGGTYEIGQTVASVNLTYSFDKIITSLNVAGYNMPERTPQTSNLNINGQNITAYRRYTATCSDGTTTASATTDFVFNHKRYWGLSVNPTLTDTQIRALYSEFATARTGQTRTFSASSQYIYFAWFDGWGVPTFTVNGLPNTAWTLVRNDLFVNASGNSSVFRVYRSDNLLTGTFTVGVS